MTLTYPEIPLNSMSDEQIKELFENVAVCQSWQLHETNLNDNGQSGEYLEETEIGARNFLRKTSDHYSISKKLLRKSKTSLSEMMSNVGKHMVGDRTYISITVGYIPYTERPTVIINLRNSALDSNYTKALETMGQSQKALATSKEEVDALSNRLMESPNPGGMGFWNLITQIRADVTCKYDKDKQILSTICLIGS
jgi:hypothetical protein